MEYSSDFIIDHSNDTANMKICKSIHIHTDYKFIHNTNLFEGESFTNDILIIQNNQPYKGKLSENITLINEKDCDIINIVKICRSYNFVVLYDLDSIKCRIANALPKDVIIFWRFFGYELYSRKRFDYLGTDTLKQINKNYNIFQHFYNNHIIPILSYPIRQKRSFYKAVKRINYILGLFEEEYIHLTKKWELPSFIQIPLFQVKHTIELSDFKEKEHSPSIIAIGNSRSTYNNHIEIIKLIEQSKNKENYNFTLLFNYGPENCYTYQIRRIVENKKYFSLVEAFIPPEEFKYFYSKYSALVINGYRQMAMGNIFLAIQSGVKIYLNKKNVVYHWFLNNDFSVFPIDSLTEDIENNNVMLDKSTALHNLEQLKKIAKNYTKEHFQKYVLSILEKK
ncbi:MAG: hypothetical protein RBR97_12950 [Bacteroidales bacterium]|jgi:dTDP-N-acetylfucosamine:lipid II N-acetylfucosaminyltransferase|nr:hypothetical protein [Bacteroidales bacterium]